MQTPHQTLAVQALRNSRCVEKIAHGRSTPLDLSRSFNPTQYATSGGSCLRLGTSSAAGGFDQQSKISEIITNQTPQPLTAINFSIAPDVVVPPNVALQRLPIAAEKVAPQLQGYSYLAVEELVAIVDTNSRKISSVMQRMRRQENSQSGQ